MKVNKAQAMMYILSLLIKYGYISKEDIKEKIDISDLTFRRYIQEIRAYFANFNLEYELVYNKSNDKYLVKE